jgi:23S rRNA (pseudouridine1915-N3)-methyltransferase
VCSDVRLILITASNRQPRWVVDGYDDYARRLDRRWSLELIEVVLARRTAASDPRRAAADEAQRMLRHVPDDAHVVALDGGGAPWSTATLAAKLEHWSLVGAPICLLVGGPDGLGEPCRQRAQEQWSLSALTLPHGLARIVVAEALYRATSVLRGHPYHRG